MNIDFQTDILKWLCQNPTSKKYISMLEADLFDLDTQYTVFQILQSFTKKYSSQPNEASMLEYFDRQAKENSTQISPEVFKAIEDAIREAYTRFTGNGEFIRETIIQKYQIKLTKKLVTDSVTDLKDEKEGVIMDLYHKMSKIKQLEDSEEDENNKGKFALAEFTKGRRSVEEGHATFLRALNRMTSTHGFYSPQLIIFMGGPKSFKTGTLLNVAMNYVRDGYKVYYADCENGEGRILDRFYQAMLQSDWASYSSGEHDDVLEEMVGRFQNMGGDFRADFFPAKTKTLLDVEDRLDELKEEHGWEPDIICYDYLDLMKPIDHRVVEKRLQIQEVYFDAIRLQKKRGLIGLGLSQVNKDAVNKAVIDMKGFAEDFGKAANVHAAFALCRTSEEKEHGLMRIVPVVQRDGVAQHSGKACYVRVNEGEMAINEIDKYEWENTIATSRSGVDKSKKTRGPRPQTIKDE